VRAVEMDQGGEVEYLGGGDAEVRVDYGGAEGSWHVGF
jgi:hypothetical protein